MVNYRLLIILILTLSLFLEADILQADTSILTRSSVKTIYIVQLSHLDIGFTDTQAAVARVSAETIDEAIALCEKDQDYKWTIESLWQLEQWMKGKTPDQIAHLMSLVKSGRIGLTACYAGMWSSIMGAEEICRSFYFAARLKRDYGVEIKTAIQNDIPGATWAYPQALKKSGVRYLLMGVNNFIGAGAEIPVKDRPFYWEGPDGSRVLTWICSDFIGKESGYLLGLWEYGWGKGGRAEETVPKLLQRLEEAGYPYDAILIIAGTGDNGRTNLAMTEGAREWNSKHESPKMVISQPDDFFSHMEAKYGDLFPVYRGDWSGLWDQNAQGTPYGTALSRQVHDELPCAEAIASFIEALKLRKYPKQQIESAWENVITYDEHSGGGGWPGTLTAEQTREGNITAQRYAQTASKLTSNVLRNSIGTLLAHVKIHKDSFFVWNPTPYIRTGVIQVGDTFILAKDVPGLGYRCYEPSQTYKSQLSIGPNFLENEYLRIEVDKNGFVTSLKDKRTGLELVDRKSKYGFGQLVQASKEYNGPVNFSKPSIRVRQTSPLAASLIITDAKSPLSKTEITLCAGEPIVRFKHKFNLQRTPYASYDDGSIKYDIAYPFNIPNAKLTFDTPAGLLNPYTDYMPKANCILNVQHGGDIAGSEIAVSFFSRQAFNWEFGNINWIWGTPIPPQTTELMMRLLSKHDEAKYKEGIGRVIVEPDAPNVLTFETAFYIHKPGDENVIHFLESEANPLIAMPIKANPNGNLPSSAQFIKLDGDGFSLLTFKKAEVGSGYVIRLMENKNRQSKIQISSGFLKIDSAELLDIVENPIGKLPVQNGVFAIEIHPREIVTIRLQLSGARK